MTKREKIIESATELFITLGFQNTSTTKITKAAGVGTGTLFLYFKSKDELVNTIYLEIKKNMMVYHDIFKDDKLEFKEQLREFWINVVSWGFNHPDQFKFMMQFKNSPYITNLTMEEIADDHRFIEHVMIKAVENGEIINQPFDFLMSVFTSQFISIIQYMTEQKRSNNKELIMTSFEILWNGIKII